MLASDADLDEIVRNGLRPLSDFPDSERWRQMRRSSPASTSASRCCQRSLASAAAEWDPERVLAWFGRDPTKLYFHVPQVAAYGGRIEATPQDVERAG